MQRARAITGRWLAAAIVPFALAACSAQETDEGTPPTATDASANATPTPSEAPAPEALAATAWRTLSEDGARYTTYLDPDGSYRDLRNGDPWQTGSWRYIDGEEGKRLCFKPDDENGLERCWEPGRVSGDTMRAKGDSGITIELERVEYQPPAEADDEAA
ncbi:hypothetical protein [Qipengyuania sp.]|uniref:hypothetical protein n=1 Tax=Qipengyuania sp. TaxID=2004515 RepID=UPI003AF893AF